MRFTKKDIKTGYYVCLDNAPWFLSSYRRGEDKRTMKQMRKIITPKSKPKYYRVVKMSPLTYEHKIQGYTWRDTFYLKWVTDVCKNYHEVVERRKNG